MKQKNVDGRAFTVNPSDSNQVITVFLLHPFRA